MIDLILLNYIGEGLCVGVFFLILYLLIPDNFLKFKIASLILGCVISSIFIFYAGKKVELDKQEIIKLKLESEIAELKIRSNEKTIQVVTKYVDKIKVIEREKIVYATKTNEILNDKIVNNYPVPNGFIRLHNSAAEGNVPETAGSLDEEPSAIKINKVAETVIDNYISCRENIEQLTALQNWIKEQERLFNNK